MAAAPSDPSDQHKDSNQVKPDLDLDLDDIQREKEVLRLITRFNILIGNASNQYMALLKSQARQHPELNLIGICQTSKQLQNSIPANNQALVVITLSHLLDGPVNTFIQSLSDKARGTHFIVILKNDERISGFKDMIKSGDIHVIDESSIGHGGLHLCLQSINSDRVFKDPVAVKRLEQESASKDQLSQRELEVIALVADGLSNREIAERLQIVQVTARDHVNRVLHKLGAKDRTEAAVIGIRLGIIH